MANHIVPLCGTYIKIHAIIIVNNK